MILRPSEKNILDNLHREFPDTKEMNPFILLNEYAAFRESDCPTFPEWLGWTNSAVNTETATQGGN